MLLEFKQVKIAILFAFFFFFLLGFFGFTHNAIRGECDIKEFYEGIIPNSKGTKILNKWGDLEEVEVILVPTKINVGQYKVNLTRKGSNIYKIEGTKYWLETKYCYEYALWEDVILIVESNYGYTKGKIIFY